MKKLIFISATIFSVLSAWAQTPSGVISRPIQSSADTNQLGLSNLSFTNQAGVSYSVSQLAGALQNLGSAVDQARPVLAAFTENFSSGGTNANQSVVGTISGILGGALNRNSSQSSNSAAQGSSLHLSNLVSGAERLLNKNAQASPSINPNTVRDLMALQNQLEPVNSTLHNLNISGVSNSVPANPVLTPTGR